MVLNELISAVTTAVIIYFYLAVMTTIFALINCLSSGAVHLAA